MASLAARIALVDTVEASATAYDDISWLLYFYRCADFHADAFCGLKFVFLLTKASYDASASPIWIDDQFYLVSH